MEHTHRRPHNQLKHPWLTYLLILFVPLAGFSIQVGFSLKPYMIFLIVVFFLYASSFIFDRLQPFEWTMLMFYFLYCFSGIFFNLLNGKFTNYHWRHFVFGILPFNEGRSNAEHESCD